MFGHFLCHLVFYLFGPLDSVYATTSSNFKCFHFISGNKSNTIFICKGWCLKSWKLSKVVAKFFDWKFWQKICGSCQSYLEFFVFISSTFWPQKAVIKSGRHCNGQLPTFIETTPGGQCIPLSAKSCKLQDKVTKICFVF